MSVRSHASTPWSAQMLQHGRKSEVAAFVFVGPIPSFIIFVLVFIELIIKEESNLILLNKVNKCFAHVFYSTRAT